MAETILESVLYIPTPIVTDILARLPPKAVIRCRCVCKSWLKLISEPEFVNQHLSKSPTCLILFQHRYDTDSFSLVEVEDETDHNSVPHIAVKDREIPFSHGHKNYTTLIGSIDGLVCINEYSQTPHQYYGELIHVYNPIMGEFITVQTPGGGERRFPGSTTYGFGISSRKYLVVRIYREAWNHKVSICHVYTVGGGVWKRIDDAPYQFCDDRPHALFFNGNLHWVITWDKDGHERICCLDLGKEVFHPFPAPPGLCQDNNATLNLYKGCLSVCDNSTSDMDIVIWVMKEYGVGNSWSKEVVISKDLIPNDLNNFDQFVYIIKVFNDGKVLLLWVWDDTLYSHDPKRKTMKDVSRIGYTNKYHIVEEATDYVPSIVSLKSMGEVNIYTT